VTGLPRSSRAVMDSADFKAAKKGDVEAAASVVNKIWGEKQTRELAARLDPNSRSRFWRYGARRGIQGWPFRYDVVSARYRCSFIRIAIQSGADYTNERTVCFSVVAHCQTLPRSGAYKLSRPLLGEYGNYGIRSARLKA
jgi:hypothetical protein